LRVSGHAQQIFFGLGASAAGGGGAGAGVGTAAADKGPGGPATVARVFSRGNRKQKKNKT